ncbi:diacylglycerol/lipid kinase family protein [Salinimicrobium sp. HB62]|uniref:diacylglycerol/lipid kinase family protein n=1 Tax=Salinimicrobium sp. HB62 TaxID=3077781 RepID=UPI002D79E088|nr:diacylglycerol kinase family protein [Salinimicrobium sp. HB62]
MKKAVLIHNPTAGSGEHDKAELMDMIASADYDITYFSTNQPGWQEFTTKDPEIVFVAGGDGTVQNLAQSLLMSKRTGASAIPVQILPFGTANNIAHTLEIPSEVNSQNLKKKKQVKSFDIGKVSGIESSDFFIEGMGFGIFPKLIREMEKNEVDNEDPDKELRVILMNLIAIVKDFEPKEAEITIDDEKINDKFLLVELLNIKFIGPQFYLAPEADPGDGKFDLVVIPEENRALLIQYLQEVLQGRKNENSLRSLSKTYRGKKAILQWKGKDVHIDDDLVEHYKKEKIVVEVDPGKLKFLVEE